MEEKTKIRQCIQTLLAQKGDRAPFDDDSSLIVSGRLSSVDAVEIVVMLEQEFGIDFAEIGFDQDRIDSVDNILEMIRTARPAN